MTNLLIKFFIKDYKNVGNPCTRQAYGNLGSIIGIIANLFLCAIKICIGIFLNSVAILADGINNLSDAGSSVITLIGFKISVKPADEDHPFGHARSEYIAGLIISFLILMLGIQLIKSSIDKIFNPEPTIINTLMFVVLICSILLKIWLSAFNYKLGKLINSSTMCATAADSRNDAITTTAILVSVIIAHFTGLQLDGYMGCGVGLFILYSGINILKETTSPLLGQAPDDNFTKLIQDKLKSYDGILGFHDLVLHSYGPNHWFASVHLEVSADEDLLSCHDKLDYIERDFKNTLGVNLVIHPDPVITSDSKTRALQEQVGNLILTIDKRLSIHDFRIVVGTTHTNLVFDVSVPASFKMSPKELARQIDQLIKQIDPTFYTVITVDTNYVSTSISSNDLS